MAAAERRLHIIAAWTGTAQQKAMTDGTIRVGRPDDAKVLTAYNVAMAKVNTVTYEALDTHFVAGTQSCNGQALS